MLNGLLCGGMDRFSSVKIIENPNCLEETEEPKKIHKEERWMMHRCYHKRVQKKWIKRYGYVMRPVMYQTISGHYICHPTLAARLRKELGAI